MELSRPETCLESSAMAALYQQHAPVLLAYFRRHLASWEDAEDALLDVFTAALEDERFPALPEAQQGAWLQRVAQHKLADYYRLARRRPAVPLGAASEALLDDEALSPEQMALRTESYAQLYQALRRLPAHQQELLHLRFAHGLHHHQIAAVLGKQEGTVRVLLWRALTRLRTLYEKPGKDERDG